MSLLEDAFYPSSDVFDDRSATLAVGITSSVLGFSAVMALLASSATSTSLWEWR
jgi:hypothetical protein